MSFESKLSAAVHKNKSLLCIGLDPDPSMMPVTNVLDFNRSVIEATADLVCAYKPNLAFYEALGPLGNEVLARTIDSIPTNIPIIGDAKRGDVSSTSTFYAKAMFDVWGFDATTVHPYLGSDSIKPFLAYQDKGIFVLCRTSNPGAREFQDLPSASNFDVEPIPLYQRVALQATAWNTSGNVGLVVGATYPDELGRIRSLCPDMPILVPGVGSQGGALEASVANGIDASGKNILVTASRSILYSSKSSATFAETIRKEAASLRDKINQVRGNLGFDWPDVM